MNVLPTSLGRRALFQRAGFGLGGVALTQLLRQSGADLPVVNNEQQAGLAERVAVGHQPHFPAKIKNVTFLVYQSYLSDQGFDGDRAPCAESEWRGSIPHVL